MAESSWRTNLCLAALRITFTCFHSMLTLPPNAVAIVKVPSTMLSI